MVPIRNFLVPQSTQIALVAARPFFMVTLSISLDSVFTLHLTQNIAFWVVVVIPSPLSLWCLADPIAGSRIVDDWRCRIYPLLAY